MFLIKSSELNTHLNDLWSFDGGAVKNPGRVESEPGRDPGQGEADEDGVAHALVLGVDAHLGALQPYHKQDY
jgi:hypothetical protein